MIGLSNSSLKQSLLYCALIIVFRNCYGNDFFNSTANRFIRSSHSSNVNIWNNSCSLGANKKSFFYTNFGFQTNKFFGSSDENSPLTLDFFNVDLMRKEVIDPFISNAIVFGPDSYSKITKASDSFFKAIKDLYVGEVVGFVNLGAVSDFDDLKIGVDLPLLAKVNYAWVSSQENVDQVISSLEPFKDLVGMLPSFDQAQDLSLLKNTLVDSAFKKDYGLGDVKFFLEKNLLEDTFSYLKMIGGVELYVALRNSAPTILPILSVKNFPRKTLFDFKNPSSLEAFTGLITQWVQNMLVGVAESRIRSSLDNFRSGFGVYLSPSIMTEDKGFEIFSKIRGSYLFAKEKLAIFPLANQGEFDDVPLEVIGLKTKVSPLFIFHPQVGAVARKKGFSIGLAYDYYYSTAEYIDHFSEPIDGANNNIKDLLLVSKAVVDSAQQHSVLAHLGYRSTGFENVNFFTSLTGNIAFLAKGSAYKTWGVSLMFGASF